MGIPRLDGKTILITGGTSGIGLESAVDLAAAGARIIVTGRNRPRADKAVVDIKARSGSQAVDLFLVDFESLEAVRRFAADFLAKYPRLDVLINNAGTVYPTRELTADGYEKTFAVNHLAPFLLTSLLLPRIEASAPARIVTVSSIGYLRGEIDFNDLRFDRGYSIMKGYMRSKLANVLFTRELGRRLAGTGVTANCLHPGGVATNIWSYSPWYARPIFRIFGRFMFITPHEGSKTITYLASSPEVENVTGGYFSESQQRTIRGVATDDAVARRLWDVSAAMTGLGQAPGVEKAATHA